MPFVKDNNYVDEDEIDADSISDNFRKARRWLNGEITLGDIQANSIETRHLVKPENIYGQDYRYTSGLLCWNKTSDGEEDAQYLTALVKQDSFTSKITYIDVPKMGRKLNLERSTDVVVTAYANVKARHNMLRLEDEGKGNKFYMFVDGSLQDETECMICDWDWVTESSTEPIWKGTYTIRSIPLHILWTGLLSAGEHTIQVKCDPYLEMIDVRSISFLIEGQIF